MFTSPSSTCIKDFSNWHALFVFLSHSVAVAAWIGIQRVDPQMIHFELFYHLVRRIQFNPPKKCVYFRQLKKIYVGYSSKKDNHLAPFHSKAFVLLYKFETSCTLIGRLSRGFFAISGASTFKHFKQLFTTLLFDLLTMWDWASLSSLLFCI